MPPSPPEDFRNVRLWRNRLELSQREFARLVGVSPTTIHFWETGERIPNSEDREKLCNALGGISELRLKMGPDWISADELLAPLPQKQRELAIEIVKAYVARALLPAIISLQAIPHLADLADDLCDLTALLDCLN